MGVASGRDQTYIDCKTTKESLGLFPTRATEKQQLLRPGHPLNFIGSFAFEHERYQQPKPYYLTIATDTSSAVSWSPSQ